MKPHDIIAQNESYDNRPGNYSLLIIFKNMFIEFQFVFFYDKDKDMNVC